MHEEIVCLVGNLRCFILIHLWDKNAISGIIKQQKNDIYSWSVQRKTIKNNRKNKWNHTFINIADCSGNLKAANVQNSEIDQTKILIALVCYNIMNLHLETVNEKESRDIDKAKMKLWWPLKRIKYMLNKKCNN